MRIEDFKKSKEYRDYIVPQHPYYECLISLNRDGFLCYKLIVIIKRGYNSYSIYNLLNSPDGSIQIKHDSSSMTDLDVFKFLLNLFSKEG